MMLVYVLLIFTVLLALASLFIVPLYNRWAASHGHHFLRLDLNRLQDGFIRLGVVLAVLGVTLFFWSDGVAVTLFTKLTMLVAGVLLIILGALCQVVDSDRKYD